MAEKKTGKPQLPATDLRRVLPMLAILFALLAVWLVWGGVQQWRDASLSEHVGSARDAALSAAEKTLSTQT